MSLRHLCFELPLLRTPLVQDPTASSSISAASQLKPRRLSQTTFAFRQPPMYLSVAQSAVMLSPVVFVMVSSLVVKSSLAVGSGSAKKRLVLPNGGFFIICKTESRKTQLFDTESSADDGAEHENYGEKVDARDIPLLYLETKIQNAPVESPQRQEAQKNLLEEINHRKQIDQNIIEILRLSLKQTDVLDLLTSTRTTGQPVVDDWDCYKTLFQESMWSKDGIRYEVCRSTCQYLQYGSGCEAKCCSY